jgi:hypothetical protein
MVTAQALWNAERDVAAQADTSDSSLISLGRRAITVYALIPLWSLEVLRELKTLLNFHSENCGGHQAALSLRFVIMSAMVTRVSTETEEQVLPSMCMDHFTSFSLQPSSN